MFNGLDFAAVFKGDFMIGLIVYLDFLFSSTILTDILLSLGLKL